MKVKINDIQIQINSGLRVDDRKEISNQVNGTYENKNFGKVLSTSFNNAQIDVTERTSIEDILDKVKTELVKILEK
tara:strand:- start:291 stop:518 length:228 start_codon:yes stop_codon:yes gene_type:complete